MIRSLSMLQLGRLRPPIRRVLAVDAGSRRLKLLLAQSEFGRLRILEEELIDLQAEGLVSSDEIKTHLQSTLQAWARPPLAVVLPQHLSISQLIDLPLAPDSDVEKLIQDETVKLGGVSESRVVYDFVRAETAAQNRQQFWVTLSQEGEIRDRILRLGVEHEDLCEVTTTANALIAAYRASPTSSPRAVLVHLGAQTTIVVILLAGQGVFATSFQMGGDFFTRSLARLRNSSEANAEALKRAGDLLNGPNASRDFAGVMDGWVAELKRQLQEWFDHNPSLVSGAVSTPSAAPRPSPITSFDLVASGGAFDQPGLLDYLKQKAGLNLRPWPKTSQPDAPSPSKHFEVAYGAALQALGYSSQPVSLLPDDYRRSWRKRLNTQRLEFASALLLGLCLLFLAFGTWRQWSLWSYKQALLNKVVAGQEAVDANDALTTELLAEYEGLRPLFAGQQNTLDTLKTLSLLQQSRSNRSFWFVLLADQQSYFSPSPVFGSTNKTPRTNALAQLVERVASLSAGSSVSPWGWTNLSPAKPGFIAELCVPDEAEAARHVRSQLVNDLKRQPLFAKVDLLSDDLRRNLAEPKVLLPDRHFALALDFAETDFQYPPRPKRPGAAGPSRGTTKRPPRPAVATPEDSESQFNRSRE